MLDSIVRFEVLLLGAVVALLRIDGVLSNSYLWLDQVTRQEELMRGCTSLKCLASGPLEIKQLDHILVDHNHRFLYCYVPKVACTNWKRVLMVLTDRSNATDLVSIPADVAHDEKSLLKLSELPEDEAFRVLSSYTSFLMVRHPFERLLSAYRNKLVGDKPSAKYFQSRIGKHIVKTYRKRPAARDLEAGDNVTFREFVRYLLDEGATEHTNEHWTSVGRLCRPCLVNYTFIGKYEKFEDDSRIVLEMIGAPSVRFPQTKSSHTGDRLRTYFSTLALEEIRDLYKMYEADFRLFGYNLENILGYDIG